MSDKLRLNLLNSFYKTLVKNGPLDKRRHDRKECLINTIISASDSCSSCYLLDLNHHGAYLETDQAFSINELVSLSFIEPDSRKPVAIGGKVIRTDSQGIGILFDGIASYHLRSLQIFTENDEKVYVIKS